MATEILLCENCGTWTLHTLVRSESVSGRAWKCESCLSSAVPVKRRSALAESVVSLR